MLASQKWTAQTDSVNWKTAEVGLEHSDLLRLLHECGLGRDESVYSTVDLYTLLDMEVDRLLAAKVYKLGFYNKEEVKSYLADLSESREKLVAKMRASCE